VKTFKERLEERRTAFDKAYPSEQFMAGARAALELAAEDMDAQRVLRWMKTPDKVADELRTRAKELSDG
jgi:hypothetical protein